MQINIIGNCTGGESFLSCNSFVAMLGLMLCLDTATAARATAALVGDPPSDRVDPLALNATLAIAIRYNAPWAHGQAICWSDKIVSD